MHKSELIGSIYPQCTISVTDNGYPQARVSTTQATITVAREPAPSFTQGPYSTVVDETDPVGSNVITVFANKLPSVTVRHPFALLRSLCDVA